MKYREKLGLVVCLFFFVEGLFWKRTKLGVHDSYLSQKPNMYGVMMC